MPFREGGSLPGLVEANDDGLYVVKFRGAGNVPELARIEIDPGERFYSLSSPSSTIIQPSAVHTGIRTDPAVELEKLFRALVLMPTGA